MVAHAFNTRAPLNKPGRPAAPPRPLLINFYTWQSPFIAPGGKVWVHIHKGRFADMDTDQPRARQYLNALATATPSWHAWQASLLRYQLYWGRPIDEMTYAARAAQEELN